MKLLIIGGFLGSGKTTLLVNIAKILSSSRYSVVVVENEIGEIGVDGKYLQSEGIQYQELYGGCICCTLSNDLRRTVEGIHKNINPDWVIIEPTGAADISYLKHQVRDNLPFIEKHVTITVIDPLRHFMLLEMLTPLLKTQICSADVLAINKIDLVGTDEIGRIVRSLKRMAKETVPVAMISAEKQTNLPDLLQNII
jgi:G3E family GTPase